MSVLMSYLNSISVSYCIIVGLFGVAYHEVAGIVRNYLFCNLHPP